MKPSAHLQKQSSPVQPINPSNRHSLRKGAGLGICSLMSIIDAKTYLANRWPKLLFDIYTNCKGWEKGQSRCQRRSEQIHQGNVPGTGSWCQMGVCQWEMQDECLRLKSYMSTCTVPWRFRKGLGAELQVFLQLRQNFSGWAGYEPAFLVGVEGPRLSLHSKTLEGSPAQAGNFNMESMILAGSWWFPTSMDIGPFFIGPDWDK